MVGGVYYYYFHQSISHYKCIHDLRRVCAGKHLAHSTLTIAAASVLLTFDVLRKVDENGREIELTKEYKSAAVRSVSFSAFALFFFLHMSFIVNHWTSLV